YFDRPIHSLLRRSVVASIWAMSTGGGGGSADGCQVSSKVTLSPLSTTTSPKTLLSSKLSEAFVRITAALGAVIMPIPSETLTTHGLYAPYPKRNKSSMWRGT